MSFPFRMIWNLGIHSKISFFLWNAYLDKILTINYLQSKRVKLSKQMCHVQERDGQSSLCALSYDA